MYSFKKRFIFGTFQEKIDSISAKFLSALSCDCVNASDARRNGSDSFHYVSVSKLKVCVANAFDLLFSGLLPVTDFFASEVIFTLLKQTFIQSYFFPRSF